MTVKSRIWWAFLTGTATEYRELLFLLYGRSGYSLILVWSINGPSVHTAEMEVHDTPWLFPSIRPTISGSLQSCKKMLTIEMGFPAYPAMPRTVCSEVLKKIVIVLSMRR